MDDNLTPNAAPVPPRAAGRGIRWALAASVAVNLAVLAMVVAMVASPHGPGGRDGMVRDLGFGSFTEALRPEDRATLRDRFLERAPDFRAEKRRLQAEAAELLAALRAEPFDPAALAVVMDRQTAALTARIVTGQDLMQDYLTGLSAAERLAFADRLQARMMRGRDEDDRD